MSFRFFVFLFWQAMAAGIGYAVAGWPGCTLGLALAGLIAVALDSLQTLALLRGLRTGLPVLGPGMRLSGWRRDAATHVLRQLRQREKLHQAAQARLRDFLSALQESPNGVVLLDAQARIEWCNQTAASQLGIDAQRDQLQHIGNLVRDPAFSHYLSSTDFSRDVCINGRNSSPSQPLQLSVHLHAYGEGRKLLLTRDITALEQAQAMQREFVANVSHEIRTPLTVLAGFVETLQTLPLSAPEQSRYLQLMAQKAQRMQTLVQDLLALSRLEGSPPPGTAEQMPLSALMAECEAETRALSVLLTGGVGHRLQVQPPHEAVVLLGAASELRSALGNLLSNAVRYTPAGGTIQVEWQPMPQGEGALQVHDSGPGIAPEHLPRLSQRFYRVDRSRSRETGGTGLGLAIVSQVMQRHGGRLHISSTPGQGSCFALIFPAARIKLSCQDN